ncbi:hypothetical protein SK128_018094 [Halocaridina rubra]|uniref:Uncharacterized protein n=1 Tax=Halocaridina rubra TaxID=373956 RepID=A0AAN8XJX7_HALRR
MCINTFTDTRTCIDSFRYSLTSPMNTVFAEAAHLTGATSRTYYTCPECQSLQDLFVYDDTRPPSEEELPLDEILKRRSRSRSKSGSRSKDGVSKSRRSRSRSRSSSKGPDGKDAKTKTTKTSTLPKPLRDAPQDHPDAIERRSRSRSRSKSLTREIVASFREFRDKVTRGRSRSKSRDRMSEDGEPKRLTEGLGEDYEQEQGYTTTENVRPENLGNGDVRIPIHIHVDAKDGITAGEKDEKEGPWKEVSSEKITTRLIFHGSEGRGDRTLTLEQVTSLRTPETSRASDVARDVIRWHDPPPSAAGPTSQQTSTAEKLKNLASSPLGPSSISPDPAEISQATVTRVPSADSAGGVQSVDASVLGSPTSTLFAAASPAAVDFLLQASKGGASGVLRNLISTTSQTSDTTVVNTPPSTTTLPDISDSSLSTVSSSHINPSSDTSVESQSGEYPKDLSHLTVTSDDAKPSFPEKYRETRNLSVRSDAHRSDEQWPLPPSEPDILKIEQHQTADSMLYTTSIDEDIPLPPPPRPPSPPTHEIAEIPPPRPPEPLESSSDIQNNNYLFVRDTTPTFLFPLSELEIAPPRPSPPNVDDSEESPYENAPPRPDPPSDDADDEREPTPPPRPEPPLSYEYSFLPRPLLPTIRETSPLHEDYHIMEDYSETYNNYEQPQIRPTTSIITSFTPPRPSEVETVAAMPSPPLPSPPETSEQPQKLLAPVEAVPLPSSPSEPPCPSTTPEKSETSPDKTGEDSEIEIAAAEPVAPASAEAAIPEPTVSEPVIPKAVEALVEDAISPQPTGLPPQHPHPKPDEDELLRKMKKPIPKSRREDLRSYLTAPVNSTYNVSLYMLIIGEYIFGLFTIRAEAWT